MCGSDVMLEMSPLASAAAQGNIEMVELLVENRANVNATTVRDGEKGVLYICT